MVREEFHVTSIVLYKDSPLPFFCLFGFPKRYIQMDTLSRTLVSNEACIFPYPIYGKHYICSSLKESSIFFYKLKQTYAVTLKYKVYSKLIFF